MEVKVPRSNPEMNQRSRRVLTPEGVGGSPIAACFLTPDAWKMEDPNPKTKEQGCPKNSTGKRYVNKKNK